MIHESGATSTLSPPETKASVLITITTPGTDAAICRLGNSEDVVRGLTVRELIQRIISPSSLFSVGVPISQLQAESAVALAIGELVTADCCEVIVPGRGGLPDQAVPLGQPARAAAQEQTGSLGNRFLNINLEVRSAADNVPPAGENRRQDSTPSAIEIEPSLPKSTLPAEAFVPHYRPELDEPAVAPEEQAADSERAQLLEEISGDSLADEKPTQPASTSSGTFAIIAERPKNDPAEQKQERKEYVRKSDWLRAQFLPEIEALDFSGLFVGNLGPGIREEKARRTVVLADPARITEVLLRANGYRRSGDHAKALICYQELVDMDAANADFRFLLGKTLLALGQKEEAAQAFLRAKELGHEGADKEMSELRRSGHRPKTGLGFLRFWKQ